jgi:hypothetical protein
MYMACTYICTWLKGVHMYVGTGRHVLAVCLHGGAFHLFDVSSQSAREGWGLMPLRSLDRSQLCNILAVAGLDCQAVLGSENAESVHLLKGGGQVIS